MNTTSLNPVQLTWVKSRAEGRHELTASGPILGSLQQVGFWKSTSQAQFKGQTWSFQQSAGKVHILEGAYARPVAEFKTGWLGGGTLSFSDGQQFRLTTKGFWRPVWSWINQQGHKLLEITPQSKRVALAEAAADTSLPQNRLAVLIMLSWHQILQSNEEAAVAVAVSAAAAAS